ncbi:MAG: hypothetical protein EXR12_08085 [Rhodospirillaceae bacterium]|nr:hypothetical protein [Rhodospirillaceae bacterium]
MTEQELAGNTVAAQQRSMIRKLLPLLLALAAAACTRTGDTPPTTNAAPPAGPARTYTKSEDRDYCGQLAGLYLRYEGSIGARIIPNVNVTAAINECAKGNYAAGIPVLERILRDSDFTLPKRS